jgi:phage baseplate assembly protein W
VSTGLNAETGRTLSGWPHVVQSIRDILTTPVGSRVMRREYGSELPLLVDRPMTQKVVLAVYAATAIAIARWETRFELTGVELREAGPDGRLSVVIYGRYEGDRVSADIEVR